MVETTATTPAPGRGRAVVTLVAVFLLGLLLDQGSKILAVRELDPQNPPALLGGLLHLKLIRNPGAAFSMGTSVTIVFTLLAMAALVFCVARLVPKVTTRAQGFVLGMAMAGIAGNLIDRIARGPAPLRGHVVDFFAVPHFAIFNVADIFLTLAAALVILWTVRESLLERSDDKALEDTGRAAKD